MSFLDPVKVAEAVYSEAYRSLMAHSVRATVNYFRRRRVELDLAITADHKDIIPLSGPKGTPSVLMTRCSTSPLGVKRVHAFIFIHKHANRDLARICIAHELFHLLSELEHMLQNGNWSRLAITADLEKACDKFAYELCKRHDDFNRDEDARKNNIYFPENSLFECFSISMRDRETWPEGIRLDPDAPFYRDN
jgi:hypothetical protein